MYLFSNGSNSSNGGHGSNGSNSNDGRDVGHVRDVYNVLGPLKSQKSVTTVMFAISVKSSTFLRLCYTGIDCNVRNTRCLYFLGDCDICDFHAGLTYCDLFYLVILICSKEKKMPPTPAFSISKQFFPKDRF